MFLKDNYVTDTYKDCQNPMLEPHVGSPMSEPMVVAYNV